VKKHVLSAALMGLVLSACGPGISTSMDYDQSVDFSKFTTYSWFDSNNPAADDISDSRIHQAVDSQLTAKGLKKVDSGGDLGVSYQITTKDQTTYTTMGDGWGGGWRWGGMGMTTTTSQTYTDGTLMLGMFDSATKQEVWHGSATADISGNKTPDERTKQINEAVSKLLADFPPGS